jgi:hypothetical protein
MTDHRTEADGANLLARAVAPHGGIVMWRAFVYGNADFGAEELVKQSYSTFAPLDGAFDHNVVLQIKNGPMDFQIREPLHPLLGALKKTNVMMAVQAAQEYTGQQIRGPCYHSNPSRSRSDALIVRGAGSNESALDRPADPRDEPRDDVVRVPRLRHAARRPGLHHHEAAQQHLDADVQAGQGARRPDLRDGLRVELRRLRELDWARARRFTVFSF